MAAGVTVKTHVGNVSAELGARDRTQAVVSAYEPGFTDPPRPVSVRTWPT